MDNIKGINDRRTEGLNIEYGKGTVRGSGDS